MPETLTDPVLQVRSLTGRTGLNIHQLEHKIDRLLAAEKALQRERCLAKLAHAEQRARMAEHRAVEAEGQLDKELRKRVPLGERVPIGRDEWRLLEKEKRDRMQAETRLRKLEEQFTRYKRTHASGSNVSEAALESQKVRTIQARTRRERIHLKCELGELRNGCRRVNSPGGMPISVWSGKVSARRLIGLWQREIDLLKGEIDKSEHVNSEADAEKKRITLSLEDLKKAIKVVDGAPGAGADGSFPRPAEGSYFECPLTLETKGLRGRSVE